MGQQQHIAGHGEQPVHHHYQRDCVDDPKERAEVIAYPRSLAATPELLPAAQ